MKRFSRLIAVCLLLAAMTFTAQAGNTENPSVTGNTENPSATETTEDDTEDPSAAGNTENPSLWVVIDGWLVLLIG